MVMFRENIYLAVFVIGKKNNHIKKEKRYSFQCLIADKLRLITNKKKSHTSSQLDSGLRILDDTEYAVLFCHASIYPKV